MPTTIEHLRTAGLNVQESTRTETTFSRNIPRADLKQRFALLRQETGDHLAFVSALNSLPTASASRDPEIGKALLPLCVLAHAKRQSSQNEKWMIALYLRTHDQSISFSGCEFLMGPHASIAAHPITKLLPGAEAYLSRSATHGPALQERQALIADRNEKIARILEKIPDAEKSRKDVLEGMRKNIEVAHKEIEALMDELADVKPEEVPECLNGIDVKACLSDKFLTRYAELSAGIESLIMKALLKDSPSHKVDLPMPVLLEDYSIAVEEAKLTTDDIVGIGSEDELLAEIINTHIDIRNMLLEMHAFAKDMEDEKALQGIIEKCVTKPFMHDPENARRHAMALANRGNVALKEAALRLFTCTYFAHSGMSYGLDDKTNIYPLMWVVDQYLKGTVPDEEDPYLTAMAASKEFGGEYVKFLSQIKKNIRDHNHARLVEDLRESIARGNQAKSYFKGVMPQFTLHYNEALDDVRRALKCQVANLEEIKDIASNASASDKIVTADLTAVASNSIRAFGVNLEDYIKGPELVQVMDVLYKFKLMQRHPEIFSGEQHNVLNRQGIILAGSFGAGKTHLAQAIATELGAKFEMFDCEKAEKQIKDIKEASHKGPIVFFIDEADSKMLNRNLEGLETEDRNRTNKLLTEIDDIRKRLPNVFLIAATNYPEKIDEGMNRPGRYDIRIYVEFPSAALRRIYIQQSVTKERLRLTLTAAQINMLVEESEGLMPLPVIRSVIATHKVKMAESRENGKGDGEIGFDEIQTALRLEKDAWAMDLEGKAAEEREALEGIKKSWRQSRSTGTATDTVDIGSGI